MPVDQEFQLSDNDLQDVAMLVVEECETAFSSLAHSLKGKLAPYPEDLHYRALAIGLIYMLANHLRHHAAMTSIEESIELAAKYLERHLTPDATGKEDRRKYSN